MRKQYQNPRNEKTSDSKIKELDDIDLQEFNNDMTDMFNRNYYINHNIRKDNDK